MSAPPGLWQPPPPAPPSRRRLALSCIGILVVVVATLFACRTQLVSQIILQRGWPLHLYQANTRHYHILVAPADMPYPGDPRDSSYTKINAVGQVLFYDTLWTPPGVAGAQAHLVDFHTVLQVSPDSSTLRATALNDYGQVAGYVPASTKAETHSALFLWTPLQAHGSVGTVTYLTDPTVQEGYGRVWGLNDYGQVALEWGEDALLWTPDAPNSPQGTTSPIRPDGQVGVSSLHGPNAYGQVAGDATGGPFLWTPEQLHGSAGTVTWLRGELTAVNDLNDYGQVVGDADEEAAVLWTPTQAHGASGRFTRFAKPEGSDDITFFALSESGALAGRAGNQDQTNAVVWQPDAPNTPTGQLQTLGALGFNEDGSADAINTAGTVLGSSCAPDRSVTGVTDRQSCLQTRSFVWDGEQGMQDLQSLLDGGSGYSLDSAWALNERGQIVAVGTSAPYIHRLLLLTPS